VDETVNNFGVNISIDAHENAGTDKLAYHSHNDTDNDN